MIVKMETSYKQGAGLGNRTQRKAYRALRVGKKYSLPVHYLRGEDCIYLDDLGVNMKFKCIEKRPEYAIFKNSFGNRMCFRYFELAALLGNKLNGEEI